MFVLYFQKTSVFSFKKVSEEGSLKRKEEAIPGMEISDRKKLKTEEIIELKNCLEVDSFKVIASNKRSLTLITILSTKVKRKEEKTEKQLDSTGGIIIDTLKSVGKEDIVFNWTPTGDGWPSDIVLIIQIIIVIILTPNQAKWMKRVDPDDITKTEIFSVLQKDSWQNLRAYLLFDLKFENANNLTKKEKVAMHSCQGLFFPGLKGI